MSDKLEGVAASNAGRQARVVKALVVGGGKLGDGESKSLPESQVFAQVAGHVIPPPFPPAAMIRFVEQFHTLGACIEAMAANVDGFGHRLRLRGARDPSALKNTKDEAEARRERQEVTDWLETLSLEDEPLVEFRRQRRRDLEATGNSYTEVVRAATDKIVGLTRLPSYQMRLCAQGDELVDCEVPYVTKGIDGLPVLEKRARKRRFRRFVQGYSASMMDGSMLARTRWFKEFGDPRPMHCDTGKYLTPDELEKTDPSKLATEVMHARVNNVRSPYGIPRWIGALFNVLGAHEAHNVNFVTLSNNNIPSMMLAVSNGQLTEDTIERIEKFVESHVKGSSNYAQMLILEGESQYDGEDAGQVKIDAKPLTSSQHTDALFTNYLKMCSESVRESYRMPPLLIGRSDDYTRATADSSGKVADEQIFAPERDVEDWHWNRLLAENGWRWYRYESRTPNITDNRELITMLANAERTGGLSPEIARAVIEDVFAVAGELSPINTTEMKPDVPFSMQLAEKVKNQADPTEPNQNGPPTTPSISKALQESIIKQLLGYDAVLEEEIRRLQDLDAV